MNVYESKTGTYGCIDVLNSQRGSINTFYFIYFFPNVLKTIKCVAADITRGVADI